MIKQLLEEARADLGELKTRVEELVHDEPLGTLVDKLAEEHASKVDAVLAKLEAAAKEAERLGGEEAQLGIRTEEGVVSLRKFVDEGAHVGADGLTHAGPPPETVQQGAVAGSATAPSEAAAPENEPVIEGQSMAELPSRPAEPAPEVDSPGAANSTDDDLA
ncbi:MAG TPA: hypothetical protein VG265_07240 [Gaiellaceae bacterium]|jgi:hypothetical protein|nr:hypothetical protein [Gaiellaceae bacterium]